MKTFSDSWFLYESWCGLTEKMAEIMNFSTTPTITTRTGRRWNFLDYFFIGIRFGGKRLSEPTWKYLELGFALTGQQARGWVGRESRDRGMAAALIVKKVFSFIIAFLFFQ